MKDGTWKVIDAAQPVEIMHKNVAAEAERVMTRCEAGVPLAALWPAS